MNATDRAIALTVGCRLCRAPAGTECANSVDGSPREQPHHSRVVRGRRAAAPHGFVDFDDVPPNAGSAS